MSKSMFRYTCRLLILLVVCLWSRPAAAANTPVSLPVKAQLKLTGMEELKEEQSYTFVLEAIGDAPMPTRTQVVMRTSGTIDFGSITFAQPGNHTYRLYQKTAEQTAKKKIHIAGMTGAGILTLDTRVYDLQVQITSDDKGILYAALSTAAEGSGKKMEPEFINTYEPPEPVKQPKTPGPAPSVKKAAGPPVKTGDDTPLEALLVLLACAALLGGIGVGILHHSGE